MKALLSRERGGPESLELADVPAPVAGKNEVRIAVRACAINYPDVLIIEDKYQFAPKRPFSPGSEISGVIDAVGEGAETFVVGQRVMALITSGGLAELVVARATQCTAIPDALPFDQAAAFQVTYGTSYHALVDRANLAAAETLLVLGASGGVGLAAIEIARSLGAHVVAAVSSEKKGEVAKRAGASEVFMYSVSPGDPKGLAASFKAACSGGANVIFDPVGGSYAEAALRSIAWAGRYLVVGFAAGIPALPLNLTLLKGCSVVGVFWGAWSERFPEKHLSNNRALLNLYQRGFITPFVSEQFALDRGGAAIRQLADRKATGKLVVTI